jgi:2,3-bisphosphoglycerate-dependent phosphoglycerate mutase
MTILYLIRHAHAFWQPDENRPLSERGRADAEMLARLLSDRPITAIYSSPASRASKTIGPLAERLGLDVVEVPDLRERELATLLTTDFETVIQSMWLAPGEALPGSESNDAAQARGVSVVKSILSSHENAHVVISTHGNLLALIVNGLKPEYGYEFWQNLTFPDVFELNFESSRLREIRRLWK